MVTEFGQFVFFTRAAVFVFVEELAVEFVEFPGFFDVIGGGVI